MPSKQEILKKRQSETDKTLSQHKFIKVQTKDLKLKSKLKKVNEIKREQILKKKFNPKLELGLLQAEDEMEKTWKVSQQEIIKNAPVSVKPLELVLETPKLSYTRNGNHLLLGTKFGHISVISKQQQLVSEIQVRELVRDVQFLHNDTMYAVAQKKYTYLYDKTGLEMHCLKNHIEATKLDFLKYHFLLVSCGNAGWLKYQDVSTGKLVAEHPTKLGKLVSMCQNPDNAIMHLGHANGTVTLWSPSMTSPLVKILCHNGPVKDVTVTNSGYHMATSGLDGQVKIWDLRTYKLLDAYFSPTPASTLEFSQTGLLAVGASNRISVWKDVIKGKQKEPYMTTTMKSTVDGFKFCPFEDILGVGHEKGFSTMIVPGCGEANFDTMDANPYQTTKQRQETEVHDLLDKIQPEMITLNPDFLGKIDRAPQEVIAEEQRKEWEANHPTEKFVPRKRARGKSSSQRRYLRKQGNVVDERRIALKEKLEAIKAEKEQKRSGAQVPKTALDRFL